MSAAYRDVDAALDKLRETAAMLSSDQDEWDSLKSQLQSGNKDAQDAFQYLNHLSDVINQRLSQIQTKRLQLWNEMKNIIIVMAIS